MLIGLDFDNTIANYEYLFRKVALEASLIKKDWLGNKKDLKEFVLLLPNGMETWMNLENHCPG